MTRLLKPICMLTLLTSAGLAAGPATRPAPPTTPVGPRERPMVIDAARPAFVPKFAQPNRTLAGQFEARDYAYRYDAPVGVYAGYGYWGYGGWSLTGWGHAGRWGYGFVGGFGPRSANVAVDFR